MHRQLKSKKGFSLVELVLAIAIIILIGGVIAGICGAISNSFVTTYNIDDSTDYAMLYARGFENSFLAYSQSKNGVANDTYKWKIKDAKGDVGTIPTLVVTTGSGDKAVFDPQFLGQDDAKAKWNITMFYKFDSSTACVMYRIFIKDNYDDTAITRYDGSFWLPRFEQCAEYACVGSSRVVETSGGAPLNDETMKSKYGYSQEDVNQIASGLDDTYTDEIKYVWG